MHVSIVFLVRVQCRRKESSRSLSHLLMSFLFLFFMVHTQCAGEVLQTSKLIIFGKSMISHSAKDMFLL